MFSAVGRNAQILLTQKLFLKYSLLFHHYSNYHMLRSGSQQIPKFLTQKYGVARYRAVDENSSCSLVLEQLRILKVLSNIRGALAAVFGNLFCL